MPESCQVAITSRMSKNVRSAWVRDIIYPSMDMAELQQSKRLAPTNAAPVIIPCHSKSRVWLSFDGNLCLLTYHDSLPEFLGLGENHPLQHLERRASKKEGGRAACVPTPPPPFPTPARSLPQNLLLIFVFVVFALFSSLFGQRESPVERHLLSKYGRDGGVTFRAAASIDSSQS